MTFPSIRRVISATTLAIALFAFGGSAAASPVIVSGDLLTFADGPGTTNGGEFIVTVNGTWTFNTFCLQRTEYIDFSSAFTVDAVSPYAVWDSPANGGDPNAGVTNGHDNLSPETAYLYSKFSAGNLTGYNFGAGRDASANDLQNAIWMFEQEIPMDGSNQFVSLANSVVGGGGWSGLGNVRVLNLSLRGVGSQDQLFILPAGVPDTTDSTPVPEPGTLLMVVTGAAGLIARRRKTQR
jgi:hypothetical protein